MLSRVTLQFVYSIRYFSGRSYPVSKQMTLFEITGQKIVVPDLFLWTQLTKTSYLCAQQWCVCVCVCV